VITLPDVFPFEVEAVGPDRGVVGSLEPTGIHPTFLDKFRKRGIELPADLFARRGAAPALGRRDGGGPRRAVAR
jgi:hypothetical protein